jgi:hypothetical protein
MQIVLEASVRDIDSLPSCNRVRIDALCWRYTVLPLLLHLSMHYQQRVMWKVNCNLSLLVCAVFHGFVVARHYFAYSKFAGDAKGEASDYGSGAEIGELVGMVSYTSVGQNDLEEVVIEYLSCGPS